MKDNKTYTLKLMVWIMNDRRGVFKFCNVQTNIQIIFTVMHRSDYTYTVGALQNVSWPNYKGITEMNNKQQEYRPKFLHVRTSN